MSDGALRVVVDRAACRGAGECVFRAPRSFELGDDGKARVKRPLDEDEDTLRLAARSCPNFAIEVR